DVITRAENIVTALMYFCDVYYIVKYFSFAYKITAPAIFFTYAVLFLYVFITATINYTRDFYL
ncbi:hypothetical protein ACXN46_005185, partial [Escherichia coli]